MPRPTFLIACNPRTWAGCKSATNAAKWFHWEPSAEVQDIGGPFVINRYNMYTAAAINGSLTPGTSSGQAIKTMEALAGQQLPSSMAYEWTDLFYLQIIAGSTTLFVFSGAVVLVFLVLAGQYESWSLPLGVILVVPMCILCSVIGVALAGMDINIFTQIGFVVLVGLASKNAILIVEFAKSKRESGIAALRGNNPGLQAAITADYDDFLRLYSGRASPGRFQRGRRRNAPHLGHRGL